MKAKRVRAFLCGHCRELFETERGLRMHWRLMAHEPLPEAPRVSMPSVPGTTHYRANGTAAHPFCSWLETNTTSRVGGPRG